MDSISRRGFIRSASLSVAALGALSALAPAIPAFAAEPMPVTLPIGAQSAPKTPFGGPQLAPMPLPTALMGGEPFMVYVSDPSTGSGTILVGERSIPFTDGAIVQTLRQAMA